MNTIYFFVGPYVECHSADDISPADPDLSNAWSDLLNDPNRMEWNMPRGNPRTISVDGVKVYQYCGVPATNRPGAPRSPMLFMLDDPLTDSETFDWKDVDPAAEVAWFIQAYDEEFALLRKVFTHSLALRWGAVYWPA